LKDRKRRGRAGNVAWKAETSREATIIYAASSALAEQIEGGAAADAFITADRDWMKYLTERQLFKAGSDVKLLDTEIILVAPKDSKRQTAIEPNFPLATLLGDGKLAMYDVKAVPAGKYGEAALGIVYATDAKAAPDRASRGQVFARGADRITICARGDDQALITPDCLAAWVAR
jgi:ABC-type molybdate transport system substrate-binding protein